MRSGGTLNFGADSAANLITIGSQTGAASLILKAGTGNFAVQPAATGTITLGTAANTGTMTLGLSTAGQTINIASAASIAGATVINLCAGATPAANQTLNIMTGVGTAGTYAVNILTGNSTGTTQTVSIGTGSAETDITLGGTGANAIAINNTTTAGTFAVGNAMTTGTISLGGASQTGTVTLCKSTVAQTLNIQSAASTTGAQVVNILKGATPVANTTLNIMNGAGTAGTQAIAILSSGATRAGTYNIGDGAAAHVGVIGSTTASAALTLQAGSGTTGLKFSAAGNVQMVPGTQSVASPTASVTMNNRVGCATFTGFSTAAGGTQAFTISNTTVLTTSCVLVTVSNLNGSGNGAQMGVQGVTQAANSIIVNTKNNGAGALGAGDNVLINFWILS